MRERQQLGVTMAAVVASDDLWQRRRQLGGWLALAALGVWLAGCAGVVASPSASSAAPNAPGGPVAAGAPAAAASPGGPEPPVTVADEEQYVVIELEPVFPVSGVDPHPDAERLCRALHQLPQERRAACCGGRVGGSLYGECVRTLSVVLADGAASIDEAALAGCEKEAAARLDGCDWVRPIAPAPPAACRALIVGRRPAGEECRSALECAEGLSCLGVTPTARGVCSEPLAVGMPCGSGIDTLVTYTLHDGVERRHPACEGACRQGRCAPWPAAGEVCQGDGSCPPGTFCLGGSCLDGGLPGAGAQCASGRCAGDLACVGGSCQALKAGGEPCRSAFECRGSCVKAPGDQLGTCAGQCGASPTG